MANKVISIDEEAYKETLSEIKNLNSLAEQDYKNQYKLADENQRKKLTKPMKLTLKSYTETALDYFRKNHIDPRTMGEERDVIAEVRKLRNNVFSFMQVQERTYLMPFVQDVYELQKRSGILEDTGFDMINLMEIFIDLLLAGLGLSEEEQEVYRARAAKQFSEKKASRQIQKG